MLDFSTLLNIRLVLEKTSLKDPELAQVLFLLSKSGNLYWVILDQRLYSHTLNLTGLLQDGMARNYFLSTWICKSPQFVVFWSILFLPPYTRGEKKNLWSQLESNQGPVASQATTLTT